MPEIKIDPGKVTPVVSNLKTKTDALDTTHTQPEFSTSALDFIQKIKSIEDKYYLALNNYKNALTQVELNVEEAIEAYIETDEDLANQMNSLSGK